MSQTAVANPRVALCAYDAQRTERRFRIVPAPDEFAYPVPFCSYRCGYAFLKVSRLGKRRLIPDA